MTKLTTPSEQLSKATTQVLTETFDAVHDLGADGKRPPALADAHALARAAQERRDVVELDLHLRGAAVAAIAARAQLRVENPDLGGS